MDFCVSIWKLSIKGKTLTFIRISITIHTVKVAAEYPYFLHRSRRFGSGIIDLSCRAFGVLRRQCFCTPMARAFARINKSGLCGWVFINDSARLTLLREINRCRHLKHFKMWFCNQSISGPKRLFFGKNSHALIRLHSFCAFILLIIILISYRILPIAE